MVSLYVKDGSRYRVAASDVIVSVAREIAIETVRTSGVTFSTPDVAREFFITQFAGLEHEEFGVAFLNTRSQLRAYEHMFRGTLDGASVHPREVVKATLKHNAAAVILAHNHPSGMAEPSAADELVTRRLQDALALIDVRVLDHVIVAGDKSCSMAGRGYL